MTQEELFEKYIEAISHHPWSPRRELDNIIAPYLAIPRSVKDDRPKLGKIILFRRGRFGALVGTFDMDACEFDYEGQQHVWEYWMPIPELPPELPPVDKDAQDFERWIKETDIWGNYGNGKDPNCLSAVRRAWMAARGKS